MSDTHSTCAACDAALLPSAKFCSNCGRQADSWPRATASQLGTSDEAGPYPQVNVLIAVLLTLFAPFISLVAAILFMQEQRNSARRGQLKNWAIGSGVWLAVGGAIVIAGVASLSGGASGSGCKGGIDHVIPPSYVGSPGHWIAEYRCNNGGTLTRPAHARWLDE